MTTGSAQYQLHNPQGIHTECGPLNPAGQPLHLHIWPMNADHTKRWQPVKYVGRHRRAN